MPSREILLYYGKNEFTCHQLPQYLRPSLKKCVYHRVNLRIISIRFKW